MTEPFATILTAGGHANSLGRVDEVIQAVLAQKSRLAELYDCLFNDDAWVRMRAADALEKVCRQHPEWLLPYIDKLQADVAPSTQPSLQWHLAQIYRQVDLAPGQKHKAIKWLTGLVSITKVDWIVAANVMDTLAQFAREGSVSERDLARLLKIQQGHQSKSVVRRATKLLDSLNK